MDVFSLSSALQRWLLLFNTVFSTQKERKGVESTVDFTQNFQLNFEAPDQKRYPCLSLAYEALKSAGGKPAIFSAANEVAVERFLAKEITYLDIPKIIEHSINNVASLNEPSLEQLFEINTETRAVSYACKP